MSDGFVQIKAPALQEVRFRHVRSAIDLSLGAPLEVQGALPETSISGYTEWVADASGERLSLGWDWAIVRELIVVLNPTAMRSNLQVIVDDGLIESPALTRIRLLEHLETLPWRLFVQRLVHGMPYGWH